MKDTEANRGSWYRSGALLMGVIAALLLMLILVSIAVIRTRKAEEARVAAMDREALDQLGTEIDLWLQSPTLESAGQISDRISSVWAEHSRSALPEDVAKQAQFDTRLAMLEWSNELDSLVASRDIGRIRDFAAAMPAWVEKSGRAERIRSAVGLLSDDAAIRTKVEPLSSEQLAEVKASGKLPGHEFKVDSAFEPLVADRIRSTAVRVLDARDEEARASEARRRQRAQALARRRAPDKVASIEEIAMRPGRYSGDVVRINCVDILGRRPRPIAGSDAFAITVESERGTTYFGTAGDIRVVATGKVAEAIVSNCSESERLSCCTLYADCAAPQDGGPLTVVIRVYAVVTLGAPGSTFGGFD